jgi:hypothetical protein
MYIYYIIHIHFFIKRAWYYNKADVMLATDKIMIKLFQSETGNKKYMDAYEAYKGIHSSFNASKQSKFNASEESKASQYSKNASENPSSNSRQTKGVLKASFGNRGTRASFEHGPTHDSTPNRSMKIKATGIRHTSFIQSGLGLNMSAPINPEIILSIPEIEPLECVDIENPGYLDPAIISSALINSMKE